ncbi:efflux RND transporter periplasmic adaptor subunit [Nordella sp. HKS 07]|uniref:efflux RND transporter periplasmic adaptor subunit n=1 Tax=Nordella sp. HKS 07 TaxID=2712222 RepID=UPI0013E1B164|nr:efflux RND transporter periplasmic adaptor subunit [Nordella sp. HKS 07]QIG47436.1 efflux RND transporter periplasmic adaptor subunit [Nordella sp. HKS 07]
MASRAAFFFLATALVAGVLVYVYRDEITPHVGPVLDFAPSPGAELEGAGPPAAPPPPQVPVAEVVTREVAPWSEFTGYVAAVGSVELRPRVGGAIDEVSVPEGGLVDEGQLLFQIDPRPFEVAVETAEAQLRQAEALLAQAETDFDRAAKLVPNGAIPRKTYDDASAKKRERQAQVEATKAAVAAARLDLSYARVTAPISGRVDRVLVTRGNLVTGGNAGAATLLTTIVSIDPVHVHFDIDEPTYLDLAARARPDRGERDAVKLPVRIALVTEKGFPHEGVLDFIGNGIDRGTGTVRARAVVANPDGRFAPGLFARVRLATDAPRQTILIDDQAVGTDQGRRYVLVLGPQNKAEYRPVELGPVVDGLRVVTRGLNSGESIIVKGLVRPGMEVTPQPVSMAAAGGKTDLAAKEASR